MSEATALQELAAEMKKSRDKWTITWSDGYSVNYYGDDLDRYARSTKEFAWGLTYTTTKTDRVGDRHPQGCRLATATERVRL